MILSGGERSKTEQFYSYLCCLLLMSVVVNVRAAYIHIGIGRSAPPFGKELFTRLIGCFHVMCLLIIVVIFLLFETRILILIVPDPSHCLSLLFFFESFKSMEMVT